MFVIRLPNGNLLAPESALAADGQVMGDAYVEVGPADPDYPRLAELALSEQEVQDRRRRSCTSCSERASSASRG